MVLVQLVRNGHGSSTVCARRSAHAITAARLRVKDVDFTSNQGGAGGQGQQGSGHDAARRRQSRPYEAP